MTVRGQILRFGLGAAGLIGLLLLVVMSVSASEKCELRHLQSGKAIAICREPTRTCLTWLKSRWISETSCTDGTHATAIADPGSEGATVMFYNAEDRLLAVCTRRAGATDCRSPGTAQ